MKDKTYHGDIVVQFGGRITSNRVKAGSARRGETKGDDGHDQANGAHKPEPWIATITFTVSQKTT